MDGWWTQIDSDMLRVLADNGAMTPAELSLKLGMSEAATISVVSMLAQEGKVRICRVELPPGPLAAASRSAPSASRADSG